MAEGSVGRASRAWLAVWASVAAFFVAPVLYAVGVSYSETWARASDLPAAAAVIPVDEAIFDGFKVLLIALAQWAVRPLPAAWTFVVAVVVTWLLIWSVIHLARSKSEVIGGWFVKLRHKALSRFGRFSAHADAAATSYAITTLPLVLIGIVAYVLLAVLLTLRVGENRGAQDGAKALAIARQKVSSGKFDKTDFFVVTASKRRLFLMSCSERGCGVLDGQDAVFLPWSEVISISRQRAAPPRGEEPKRN